MTFFATTYIYQLYNFHFLNFFKYTRNSHEFQLISKRQASDNAGVIYHKYFWKDYNNLTLQGGLEIV